MDPDDAALRRPAGDNRRRSVLLALLAVPPALLLGVFYFYPLGSVALLGLQEGGAGAARKLLQTGYYRHILWFTFWQAAVSTAITVLVALPGAHVMARLRFRGQRLLQGLVTVPFVLPTMVVAAAFHALLGPRGLVNRAAMAVLGLEGPPIRLEHTIWLILAAHLFYNYAVVLRVVGGFWSQLPPSLGEAAQLLGAGGRRRFFTITLPLLRPAILAAALLVFVFCFCSFGVILVLGGPRYATLEVEIYRQAVHLFNLPMAAALSLVQLAVTFAAMWVYTGVQRRSAVKLDPHSPQRTRRRPDRPAERWWLRLNVALMLATIGLPLGGLVVRSLWTNDGPALTYYRALFENRADSVFFVPPLTAVATSLGVALTTVVLALLIGLPTATYLAAARRRLSAVLDPLCMLPLATSAVTLGFGFIISLDRPPFNLRSSPVLVPLAHTLVAFPFVVRILLPTLRSIPERLREAAACLGAPPLQRWRHVDLPVMGRALAVGAIFAFTVSMGEFGATVFVARPQNPTMPLAIYRFLGQPGALHYGQALAMSCVLMGVSMAGFAILERFRGPRMGVF